MPVNQRRDDIRELVETCLRDIGSGTEGFPVEPLLRDVLQACQQGPLAREQTVAVVDSLLNCWIATLERDMRSMAPPSPAVQMVIKARMQRAQLSLMQVQKMLQRLKLWVDADSCSAREAALQGDDGLQALDASGAEPAGAQLHARRAEPGVDG